MPESVPAVAPGPRGDPWLGSLRAFRRDALGLMLSGAATYGDVVRFRVGPIEAHLVNHPDLVTQVLQIRSRHYDKHTRSTAAIAAICAESLLTANGEAWEARRRLIQPAFHRQRVAQLAAAMTQCITARMAQWRPGEPVDVASEMMRLTFVIAGRTILGADVSAESATLEGDVAWLLADVFARWGRIVPLPEWLPTPGRARFRRALAKVDRVVARIIAEHRTGTPRPDLLTMLMEACDANSGAAFTDAELRNEVITMLLAGHETTASALAWTFAHLAAHPDVADRLRAEVHDVLGGRVPTLDDLSRLTLTTQVLQESLRLSPPIWAIERRAIHDDVLGGYAIPAGSSVIISPYVLHRHPRFWPDPERFDPSRFAEDKPPAAYLPFGAGPRFCVGNEFAMLEARLVVAMVMQAWRLTLVPGQVVAAEPSLTLRLRHGLRMIPTLC